MEDAHRQFFADLYHFYERHEHPPAGPPDDAFKAWWADLVKDAEALCRKYKDQPSAAGMIYGVIDGIQAEYQIQLKPL